jgi:hypothetical protein
MNEFSYHILPIIHAYNTGISQFWAYAQLQLKDVTPVICPTSVERCDSSRKARLRSYPWLHTLVRRCNSGRMPDSGRKTWLWSYTRLQSYARLWSEGVAPVVCLTPIRRCGSSRMPDSDRKAQLWSYARVQLYARLRSEDATPVVCLTLVALHSSDPRSYNISYLLICERFHMVELDDCNII